MKNYLETIQDWFRKKEKPVLPKQEPPPADLKLTHPEEPQDPSRTAANINVSEVLNQWLATWQVPQEYRDFWRTQIDIKIFDSWPVEAMARSDFGHSGVVGCRLRVPAERSNPDRLLCSPRRPAAWPG